MLTLRANARIVAKRVRRYVPTRDFKACPSSRCITSCPFVSTSQKVSEELLAVYVGSLLHEVFRREYNQTRLSPTS